MAAWAALILRYAYWRTFPRNMENVWISALYLIALLIDDIT